MFKKFRRGGRHDSLRDAVAGWFRLTSGDERKKLLHKSEFWAVEDVSFEVQPGEALGIIGPNGAGKSTLLKLLAGIMRPNRGSVTIRGRVSALIEVGAGFHPDLTGRENIFLNASILGMPRREAVRKFNEIVDFAGIHEFLDTPIKRYSSGMYARLGFAVAAHVDPQVLLVDEVLSVGDRAFRAKCVDRMRTFLHRGVSVIFVSHDLCAVSGFCDRAIVMSAGQAVFAGRAPDAVSHYHATCVSHHMLPEAAEKSLVDISEIRLFNAIGIKTLSCSPGDPLRVECDVYFKTHMANPSFGLSIMNAEDHVVVFETSSTRVSNQTYPASPGDVQRFCYDIDVNISPGEYFVGYHIRDRDASLYAAIDQKACRLMVAGPQISGGSAHLAPRVRVDRVPSNAAAREVVHA